MQTLSTQVAIIGGGLAGIYTAWRLQRAGIDFQLLEARDRLGGRILGETFAASEQPNEAFDLGPSWVWPSFQPNIAQLLKQLDLEVFEQYSRGMMVYEQPQGPAMRSRQRSQMAGSFRICGGTSALINKLASQVDSEQINFEHVVSHITQLDDGEIEITVKGQSAPLKAQQVILALPQRLIARSIGFTPALPTAIEKSFVDTATWMAGHAKVVAVYEQAFWRDEGLSGDGFSQRGPMTEIHDASPAAGGPYALFGFVGFPPQARSQMGEAQLLSAAQQQFERLFGPQAAQPLKIMLKDWSADAYTATKDDLEPLYEHPRYGLSPQVRDFAAGKIAFAATEAASENGGYLEGAINAADQALKAILPVA